MNLKVEEVLKALHIQTIQEKEIIDDLSEVCRKLNVLIPDARRLMLEVSKKGNQATAAEVYLGQTVFNFVTEIDQFKGRMLDRLSKTNDTVMELLNNAANT